MQKSRDILHKHWGFSSFRPLQEDIVDAVIYGHDTLAILPTGGGKSICYQVPGMALDGLTIVVSPLIALMQDQIKQLQKLNIKAISITSGMTYRDIDIALDNAKFGNIKFLYVSPERLKTDLFIERFKQMNVSLIVVDEAHCISEWGHDFRPAYREIANIRQYHPEVPLAAFTASATDNVKQDILTQLKLREAKVFEGSLQRTNLIYKVFSSVNKLKDITTFCIERTDCGIVYCQTRASVKEVAKQLRAHNLSAGIYHGGMKREDRSFMLDEWMNNRVRIMVATNAFGMGIDKPDVRYVLHYEVPNNLEAYYQEAGRAGRDEKSAQAIVYWENKDLETAKSLLEMKYPDVSRVKTIYSAISNFLSIAFGSGKDETYPFDLRKFTSSFNISASETYHSLKLLEANENLTFTERNFLPTRLKFSIGQSALYKFQVAHESTLSLITLLSRSYPGIFERFVSLDEQEFSKRLKISSVELRKKLEYLEEYGVIDINYQTELPLITFLEDRIPEDQLRLKPEIYQLRKQSEFDKLASIEKYLNTSECRAQFIAGYFDSEIKPCGICDNCLMNSTSTYTLEELVEIIPTLLPQTRSQLIHRLSVKSELIDNALRHLTHEEIIFFESDQFKLLRT